MKFNYTAVKCKKCGKKFARHSEPMRMIMHRSDGEIYKIRQDYCKECAEEKIKKDPLCHRRY